MKKLSILSFLFLFISSLHASQDPAESAFTSIYQNHVWGTNQNGEGSSGGGSTQGNAHLYRCFLENFLKENHIATVIDAGCGDWEFSQLIDWRGIQYFGIDIVLSVIERNIQRFSSPSLHFIHANAIRMDLPAADLLVCKDVLQHLPNEDISRFIRQFSKYKHCLITNDVDRSSLTSMNSNIRYGEYRPIDLRKPPFNLKGKSYIYISGDGFFKQIFHIAN